MVQSTWLRDSVAGRPAQTAECAKAAVNMSAKTKSGSQKRKERKEKEDRQKRGRQYVTQFSQRKVGLVSEWLNSTCLLALISTVRGTMFHLIMVNGLLSLSLPESAADDMSAGVPSQPNEPQEGEQCSMLASSLI
uniref:Uncharacterized protein n=2 Tax=Nothobranchius TaxID=28779 RepID=A0A1A8RZ35_9TELE